MTRVLAWRIPTGKILSSVLVKRGAWGIPDQTFISLSNFVTTILVARALSPESFGEFAVAFASITVAMALAAAALTQPFVVLSSRLEADRYRRFVTSTFLAQLLAIAIVAIPAGIGFFMAVILGWKFAALLGAAIPAFAAWQIQEFIRQVFYTENRFQAAFLNDIISYGGQMALFGILSVTGNLTSVSGLLVLALTSCVAAVEGMWLLRRSFSWAFSQLEFYQFLVEIWNFGRWTLAHATIGAVSGFSILLMLATLSGPGEAGALRAFVVTTAPMRILIAGAKTSFGPGAAKIAAQDGMAALRFYVRHVFLLVGPVVILYCLFLAIFAHPVLNILVGTSFGEFAHLLPVFIAAYLITEIPFAIEIGLRACRITDILFHSSLIAAIGAWVLGPPLILLFGLSGLLWLGLALAPFAGVMQWLRYRREMRRAERVLTETVGRELSPMHQA